ncbi:MAG: SDR family oxidoreductase [Alphaproteobacteria bacterium]|nr:MAG: SDR family oxidoreductase [Alphaproteobacteria bacterium]
MMKNKVVLITDALHFFGKPASRKFTGEGATLYAEDAAFADATVAADYEKEFPGTKAVFGEPEEVVEKVLKTEGRIDVMINNDAFPALKAKLEEASIDDFRNTIEGLMVRGFRYAKAVTPSMKAAKKGKIIFISSAAPKHGIPNYSMYVAARGGTNALAHTLAKELGPFNIQVNALAPNFVESPTYFPKELIENEAAFAKITKQIPLRRLGRQEEAGDYLLFLASGKSDYITGQVLYFAGGWA